MCGTTHEQEQQAKFQIRQFDFQILGVNHAPPRRVQSMASGFYKTQPDQRAIMDKAGPEGFYVACGFSGTGFKLSPAVGVCMAELILDGGAKLVDISSLNLDRFVRGELIQGEHSYGHIWK